jgi:hypothetical protein
MKHKNSKAPEQLPHLLRQETGGMKQYLRILFRLYSGGTAPPSAEDKIRELCEDLVADFIAKETAVVESQRTGMPTTLDAQQEVLSLAPVVVVLLAGAQGFTDEQFLRHLPWLYPLLTALLKTQNNEIRGALYGIFSESIAKLLPLSDNLLAVC